MSDELAGGCLCGAVRFGTKRAPLVVRACWCRVCQYLAAGNATVNMIVPTDGMEITGETRAYQSRAESGNLIRRSFCPTCGTQLFAAAFERPGIIVVRVGALDDPELVKPASIIWAASAPSWGWLDASLPCVAGQPPPVAQPS